MLTARTKAESINSLEDMQNPESSLIVVLNLWDVPSWDPGGRLSDGKNFTMKSLLL
jgi:hypothetical protein